MIRLFLTLIFCILIPNTAVFGKELDRVYAIVNEDVITKSEYEQEYLNTTLEIRSRGRELPSESILRRQILDRMVTERLQLQIADRVGVQISPAQIESAVSRIAQGNNLNLEQLQQALKSDGISYQAFKERIENQIRIQQLIEGQINSRVNISDLEVEEFLRSEHQVAGKNSEFNVSHIIVQISSATDSGSEQARKQIEQARAALLSGEEFADVAQKYSTYKDALEGGALGWHKAGELPKFYYQALREMSEGKVSEVLHSNGAFHIIKLNKVRSSTDDSDRLITQLRLRQIFLEFDQVQTPEYMQIKLSEIARRLSNGENFATLAELYSQDDESRIKGGDMGWIGPGDLASTIEDVIYKLSPGEISMPMQVGNGVGIYEVIDKRQQAAGNVLEKNAAREQLHIRKAEQQYQDWLQDIRDRAYIQYLADVLD